MTTAWTGPSDLLRLSRLLPAALSSDAAPPTMAVREVQCPQPLLLTCD